MTIHKPRHENTWMSKVAGGTPSQKYRGLAVSMTVGPERGLADLGLRSVELRRVENVEQFFTMESTDLV